MGVVIQPESPPLRVNDAGEIRVGTTRVLLALVLRAYLGGATPEDIVRVYDSLDLADVYATIAYYLRHREELDRYLADYDREGDEVRKEIETSQPDRAGLKDRLLARRAGGGGRR